MTSTISPKALVAQRFPLDLRSQLGQVNFKVQRGPKETDAGWHPAMPLLGGEGDAR